MATRLHRRDLHRLNNRNGSSPSLAAMLPRNLRRLKHLEAASAEGYCLQSATGQDAPATFSMAQVTSDSATFEAWIQTTSEAEQAIFFSQNDTGGLCTIELAGNAVWLYWYPDDTRASLYSKDTKPVSDGQWHHIAVVFNHGVVTIYKDGLPTGDGFTVPSAQTTGTPLVLGGYFGSSRTFDGQIYDMRVWNTARKTTEIQGFMYAQLTGQEAGLVALCNFPNGVLVNQVTGQSGTLSSDAKIIQTTVPQAPPPQPLWTYDPTGTIATAPALGTGAVILSENMIQVDNSFIGVLRSLDVQQTETPNWSYDASAGLPAGFLGVNVAHALSPSKGTVYAQVVVDQSGLLTFYLDAIDAQTGQRQWRTPLELTEAGDPALVSLTLPVAVSTANGDVIMFGGLLDNNQGMFVGLSAAEQGQIAWRTYLLDQGGSGGTLTGFTPAAMWDGNVAIFGATFSDNTSTLYAFDSATGVLKWSTPLTDLLDAAPLLVGDMAYCAASGTLFAIDLNTGAVQWSYKTIGVQTYKPAVMGSSIYVGSFGGSSGGTFAALDVGTGQLNWQLPIPNGIATDVVILDGIAYFASFGDTGAPPVIFSMDLATQGADIITYTVPSTTSITSGLVANGVVYFSGDSIVLAVNMDNVIHEFSVSTACTVENYDTTQSPPVGSDTSYRVTIKLVDPVKKPRPFQAVKVWADDTLTVTSSLQTYTIGPTQPIWLETDATGEVTLAIEAVPDPQVPLIHCPALIAWANFMLPQEAIVVYPDHENLAMLSNIQATNPNPNDPDSKGLDTAKGYDGTAMLQSSYQDENSRQQIANSIQNTVGSRNATPQAAGANTTKYLAFPEFMPFAVYQPTLGDTSRAFAPGAEPHWYFSFANGASFTPWTAEQADAYFAQHWQQPNPGAPGNIFTDIADFFERVVKGAEQVAEIAWHWVEGAVQTIITTAENEFHIIINAIEDAVKCVIGFIKKVINDIKQFIQFLSYLFDWDNILATHTTILSTITSNLNQIKTWANGQAANGQADIQQFFGTLKGNVDGYFNSLIAQVQGQTVETYHAQNNDPNVAYRHNGKDKTTQCTWMHQKVKDNMPNSSTGASGLPGDTENPIVAAFSSFFDQLETTLTTDFASVPSDVQNLIDSVPQLFSNPSSFTQNALADLLDIVKDIADAILDVGEAVAEFFVNLLVAILDELLNAATQPIQIPFVSDLYKAITGDDLSFLDVVALIVAIPTTIITEIINATAGPTDVTDSTLGVKIANGIFLIIGGFVDAADTALPGGLLDGFDAVWVLGSLATSPFVSTSSWVTANWVFYGIQWFPVIGGFFTALGSKDENPGRWATWWYETGEYFANCAYGLLFLITSCIYASAYPDRYSGLSLAENIIGGSLPFVIDPLRVDTESLPFVAGAKLLLEEVSAIMTIVGYFASGSQPAQSTPALSLARVTA